MESKLYITHEPKEHDIFTLNEIKSKYNIKNENVIILNTQKDKPLANLPVEFYNRQKRLLKDFKESDYIYSTGAKIYSDIACFYIGMNLPHIKQIQKIVLNNLGKPNRIYINLDLLKDN